MAIIFKGVRTFLLLVICVTPFEFQSFAAELTISKGPAKQVFTEKELLGSLHLVVIEVQDPVYHKLKRYAGYWLTDIFDLAGIYPRSSSALVFIALDGYKAPITYADMKKSGAKALIAVKDIDTPQGWEKLEQGKEWLSPGPYYLVWQQPSKTDADIKLPWPYQLKEISIRDANEVRQKFLAEKAARGESVDRGFKVFQQNCVACHSLNLEGGRLGPELNVPRNILEYRDRKTLKDFIGDPSSFRAKDKMPSFNAVLSPQSIDDVLNYLEWMGKHKIHL